jgi:hypothetical protein
MEDTDTSKHRAPGTTVPIHRFFMGQFHGLSGSSGESQSSAAAGEGWEAICSPVLELGLLTSVDGGALFSRAEGEISEVAVVELIVVVVVMLEMKFET